MAVVQTCALPISAIRYRIEGNTYQTSNVLWAGLVPFGRALLVTQRVNRILARGAQGGIQRADAATEQAARQRDQIPTGLDLDRQARRPQHREPMLPPSRPTASAIKIQR